MSSTTVIEQQAFSVQEFCARNRISLSTWFKLQRQGRTPRLMRFGHVARISIEAEREWRAKMEADAASDAAEIERQRRVVQASRAGKIAAASPLHVSKPRSRAKGAR